MALSSNVNLTANVQTVSGHQPWQTWDVKFTRSQSLWDNPPRSNNFLSFWAEKISYKALSIIVAMGEATLKLISYPVNLTIKTVNLIRGTSSSVDSLPPPTPNQAAEERESEVRAMALQPIKPEDVPENPPPEPAQPEKRGASMFAIALEVVFFIATLAFLGFFKTGSQSSSGQSEEEPRFSSGRSENTPPQPQPFSFPKGKRPIEVLTDPRLDPTNTQHAREVFGLAGKPLPTCSVSSSGRFGAGCEQICSAVRSAFRDIMRKVHPDKNLRDGERAQIASTNLGQAKDTLNATYRC